MGIRRHVPNRREVWVSGGDLLGVKRLFKNGCVRVRVKTPDKESGGEGTVHMVVGTLTRTSPIDEPHTCLGSVRLTVRVCRHVSLRTPHTV